MFSKKCSCDNCNNLIYYKSEQYLLSGIKNNTKCKNCSGKGHIVSQETRNKISIKNSGENNGMYNKGYLQTGENNPNYGNPNNYSPSTETRSKISKANKGKSGPMKNKKLSEESKLKISESHLGILNPMYNKKPWNYNKFQDLTNDFLIYKKIIHRLTEKFVYLIDGYDETKRGRAGINGAYQVDHIISIKDGFLNDIPEELIADISNLQFITWEENIRKREIKDLNLDEKLEKLREKKLERKQVC